MILIDTGVFVAAADQGEPRHAQCSELLRRRRSLVVAAPVVAETAWMIERRLDPAAEVRFLTLVSSWRFEIVDLGEPDYLRAIALIDRYTDLGLGFVDASVVAVAERLRVTELATLNRRDFAVVRPAHCAALHLIP